MLLAFLGDDYNRQLAEIYLVNYYGFTPISPRDWLLDGVRSIFNLKDDGIYGTGFFEIRSRSLGPFTPKEWFDLLENTILDSFEEYYEKVIIRKLETFDDHKQNILITDLSSYNNFLDEYDPKIISLNCESSPTVIKFKNNEELTKELDAFLGKYNIKKLDETK